MNEPKDQATGTPSACHCSSAVAEGLAARHERERAEGLRIAIAACVCGCPKSQHPVGGCETQGCKCREYRRPWRLTGRNALWYVVESPDGSEFRMADEDSAKRLVCKMNFGSYT